ncbi:helix-turn-helix domain-containing protein [Constantimarinum furrinae]|uniref:AraC family transcriptional regulator n=1 Tax=Constantimarinum furrinae TaxID=2562285 RepID=A0A7G8PWP4_9FLAO|nr:AraC family transcriptional regulator [Constantimarinum furrinae]QNJ98760.1 AraC family transcriptional regulator [Constantimarinum furrinae]
MIHKSHILTAKLSRYMDAMLYHKDYSPTHTMDKYLPDGTTNIIFELTDTPKYIFDNHTKKPKQKCTHVWFSGVLTDYITISASSEEMIVLVFKPGAAYPLIRESVHRFSNKVVSASEIFGPSIMELYSEIKRATTPDQKFRLIEAWLLTRFNDDDFYSEIIQYAIDRIEQSPSVTNITEIAVKSGYSQKQFIQLFKKYVGITPKQFHRIKRFNEILKAVENKEQISWTAIAQDCGYFDQAHFIKDFKSFSGLNPKQYVNDIGDYPNFFPVK